MPFTLAHPAVVLPFLKINNHYLSATGLIAGSLAPDFEYFLKMSVQGSYGHSWVTLFFIDVPVAIVMAILFHRAVKNNFIDNLPIFFQSRFYALRQFDFISHLKKFPFAFLLAVGLGVSSHLLWDSFTHPGGFFVERLPFYDIVVPFDGVNYPLYYALQNISTYAGMLAILLYIHFMKPHPEAEFKKPGVAYWLVALLITTMIVFIRFSIDHASITMGNFIVTAISALCSSFLVEGLFRFNRSAN